MIGLVVYSTFPFQIAWFSSAHYVQIRTGDREIKSIKLVDGTLVQLNRNSTLQYPNEWTGAQRDVKLLQGEAFFEVKSDSLRRFVVRTPGGLAVEVLGTAFNVVQRPERTSVFLQKGKILLRQQQQTWEMTPGEWAEFETRRKTIRIQAADDDLWLAWLNDLFVFDDVPLDEIARIMEDYYAVRIDITNPSLARQRFTGKVPRQNIHLVMNVLAKTMNVKVLWKNGKFTMQPHE
ncbi:FecR family protein [Rhabdobacter roseus]|uniref:FecR family protein n=1 Tax=Rhabdobacter roseus TaxID=1655419 RepID=UPI001FE62C8E|nr:FecR domain-containing protein [Rhabdobacter roseus]